MFNKRFLPSGFEAPSRWRSIVGLVCLLAAHPAFAINGFFIPGYGAKSLAVAGTGVAMPQDTLTTAINPAGLALIEPGIDAHAMLLSLCSDIYKADDYIRDYDDFLALVRSPA